MTDYVLLIIPYTFSGLRFIVFVVCRLVHLDTFKTDRMSGVSYVVSGGNPFCCKHE